MAITLENYLAESSDVQRDICHHFQIAEKPQEADRVLRIVLHSIRNRLTDEQNTTFMSHLPNSLFSIFVQDWSSEHEDVTPLESGDDLISEIQHEAEKEGITELQDPTEAKDALNVVINTLKSHCDKEEVGLLEKDFPVMTDL